MGLNAALGVASRALEVFSAGIQVAGQNIANANTPGYVRERLVLQTAPVYRAGELIFGTGVHAPGVVQELDRFLEIRLHAANSDYSAAAARESIFTELESQIRELGEQDLSTAISDFVATLQDSANEPESLVLRQQVIHQGSLLAGEIASLRIRLDDQRRTQVVKVDLLVAEANELIDRIVELNPQISKIESAGLNASEAGGLRTERLRALNRLSEIVPIRFQEREDGGVEVFSGSDFLILTGEKQHLETNALGDRNVGIQNVRLSITKSEINATVGGGGELRGVLEGRDIVLADFIDNFDIFTRNLIFEFNKIHASGEGLAGYSSVTGDAAVADATAALNAAGLPFTPKNGTFEIKLVDAATGATKTTVVNVDLDGIGADTSLVSLTAALDAIDNLTATITTDGNLKLAADANYEIRFAHDTSDVLATLGVNTFFTGSDTASIGVNESLKSNAKLFAASQGGGPSDGRNVLALAAFTDKPLDSLGGLHLDEFYDSLIADVAKKSAAESTIAAGLKDFRDSLSSQRQQYSGVSLDEEAILVLEFQRAYQAAARIVTTVDELFETLLSI